jgi:DNA (cytosine-5)-methyltransferase 1
MQQATATSQKQTSKNIGEQLTFLQVDSLASPTACQESEKAKEDDRHLWPEMLRAIREIQPTWIVGENVRGLVSWNGGMVFEEVQAEMEVEGYEVQPFLLPAGGVGAPHERYRIWFVAYSIGENGRSARSERENKNEAFRANIFSNPSGFSQERTTSNSNELNGDLSRLRAGEIPQFEKAGILTDNVADTTSNGFQGRSNSGKLREERTGRAKRFENMGLFSGKNWEDFPTQSPICFGDDGISSQLDGITFPKWRSESIQSAGNAIVPQVAYQIFKAIQEYENRNRINRSGKERAN